MFSGTNTASIEDLAELADINPVHLTDVPEDDARTALVGLALFHHLGQDGRSAVLEHRRTLPCSFRNALDRAAKETDSGAVQWESNGGTGQTARGTPIDYGSIGIRPNRIDLDGEYVHYAVHGGAFILFRDNPNLWYFTQNTRTGLFNFTAASLAKGAAKAVTSWVAADRVLRIPGVTSAVERLDRMTPIKMTTINGILFSQEKIPVWGRVIGTPIPKIGSETVLLYISEDGEYWPRRARFDIDSDGSVNIRTWNTER